MHTNAQQSARTFRARAPRLIAASLLALLGLGACKESTPTEQAGSAVSMDHGPAAGGFSVEVLSRSGFPDAIDATFRIKQNGGTKVVLVNDPTDVLVVKVTIQPGGSLGWHTHPGPAIASVAAGELTIINATDCVTRKYPAGNAFVDPGQGNVHIGYNASAVPTTVLVTYLDVPPGQGPTIPAQAPSGC
jgi:quercetin dioxygenase-like cupin family protein